MKAKAKKNRGRGRPKKSTNRYTIRGADPSENELRAHWGPDHAAGPGLEWAHRLWTVRNPGRLALEGNAKARHMAPADLLTELRAQPPAPYADEWECSQAWRKYGLAVTELIAAIDRRDAQFFTDAAAAMRRIGKDGSLALDSPHESALLFFVNWSQKYTLMGLMDGVPWRTFGVGCPSRRELGRMCEKLGVPMQRGRPPKI